MINCKYDKSVMCPVDDVIFEICEGCKKCIEEDSEGLFTYDIKKAISDYIILTRKSEREALLTLNQILKKLIADYKERALHDCGLL